MQQKGLATQMKQMDKSREVEGSREIRGITTAVLFRVLGFQVSGIFSAFYLGKWYSECPHSTLVGPGSNPLELAVSSPLSLASVTRFSRGRTRVQGACLSEIGDWHKPVGQGEVRGITVLSLYVSSPNRGVSSSGGGRANKVTWGSRYRIKHSDGTASQRTRPHGRRRCVNKGGFKEIGVNEIFNLCSTHSLCPSRAAGIGKIYSV